MDAQEHQPNETAEDILTQALVDRYTATVGFAEATGQTPLGIHWGLAPPTTTMSQLGPDGHPLTGGFLPAFDQPRRMWAASDIAFLGPIAVGSRIKRRSKVQDVTHKTGSSGALTFVTLAHDTLADGVLCVRENQTLVFKRSGTGPSPLPPAHGFAGNDADVTETIIPDPPLLFRYSALTFNTHRIHYDQEYTAEIEGYPALVVHGPLIASLLLRLASVHLGQETIRTFSFKAHAPAFCGQALHLGLKMGLLQHVLTAHGADGRIVLSGIIS